MFMEKSTTKHLHSLLGRDLALLGIWNVFVLLPSYHQVRSNTQASSYNKGIFKNSASQDWWSHLPQRKGWILCRNNLKAWGEMTAKEKMAVTGQTVFKQYWENSKRSIVIDSNRIAALAVKASPALFKPSPLLLRILDNLGKRRLTHLP